MNRIQYIDGLRGVAILLVIFFHAFSRWPELMPYGDRYAEFPVFNYGYLGVQLFFLISGFVILMSLEKSSHFLVFIWKRWLRLFPAMLVCSIFVYVTAGFFYERPAGQPELKDFLPGLTFIDPYLWLKLTGLHVSSLEGAFWSLYVEFKFYVIAAFLYFSLGSQRLVIALFLLFLLWLGLDQIAQDPLNTWASPFLTITNILDLKYFGWFAAGAAYYLHASQGKTPWLITGIIFSLISSIAESQMIPTPLIAALLISLLFVAALKSHTLQGIINNKLFLTLGLVSYPLYLLHENMMVSGVIKLHALIISLTGAPPSFFVIDMLLPGLMVLLIGVLAYYTAVHIEPWIRKNIVKLTAFKSR